MFLREKTLWHVMVSLTGSFVAGRGACGAGQCKEVLHICLLDSSGFCMPLCACVPYGGRCSCAWDCSAAQDMADDIAVHFSLRTPGCAA
jgi:hypothetical protein